MESPYKSIPDGGEMWTEQKKASIRWPLKT